MIDFAVPALQKMKVVYMEDLAAEFDLKTQVLYNPGISHNDSCMCRMPLLGFRVFRSLAS